MSTEVLLKQFLDKFIIDVEKGVDNNIESVVDPNIKLVKIDEEKNKESNTVNEISKLDEDNKPYALKTFGATMSSYHYKKNSKKPLNVDNGKKKGKEMVFIQKLDDLINVDKKD